MAKPKSRYTCQACGSVQHRWQGQCPDCAEWNTLVQESAEVSSIFAAKHNLQGGGRVIPLIGLETPAALPERLPSGLAEFDRAIGGGIVAGSAMLVGGDPGIGKSTLLLQVAARLASEGHKVVYVSGEESAEQVRLRAVRLGLRRHRRDRRVRDGRGGAERGAQPVGAVPDASGRAGQRHERVPGD